LESPQQLVLSLGASIEALEPFGNAALHALIETGLEMQTVILLQTAPVAPVKTVIPHQKQGTGHIPPPVTGKYQTHRFSHTRAQQRKEFRCQIGTPAALEIGGSVEGIEALPVRRCYLLPGQPLELDARPKNAFALPAEVLAFARVARREKIIETPVTPI